MTDSDESGGPAFDIAGAGAGGVREHWDEFMADAKATAAEFEEAGWETLVLHPGDVTPVTLDRWGFDVLVPDSEFDQLEEWVSEGAFDDHDVYRAERGVVFTLVVLKDEAAERAVCCPLYYEHDPGEVKARAAREGQLYTHVRKLSDDYVTFVHEDPSLFFPEE